MRSLFPIFLILLFFSIQTLICIKLIRYSRLIFKTKQARKTAKTLVTLFVVLINLPVLILIFRVNDPSGMLAGWIMKPFFIWQLSSLISIFILLEKDLIKYTGKLVIYFKNKFSKIPAKPINPARRRFLRLSTAGLVIPPFGSIVYGAVCESNGFEVTKQTYETGTGHQALKGMKIVQISDIHAGPFFRDYHLRPIVSRANELEPDIILLTGDFVYNSDEYLDECTALLRELRASLGVYACIGNHDHWIGVDRIIRALKGIDIDIMVNENRKLVYNNTEFYLLSIDDMWGGIVRMDLALKDVPENAFSLLMSHQPNIFPDAAGRNIDLTLSGHTHGGQVNFSLCGNNYNISKLASPYDAGWFKINNSRLYVNRGVGFTGPPIRLNAPAEVTLFTFK